MPWRQGGSCRRAVSTSSTSVKSTRNELIVTPTEETEQRWEGKDANQAEVAVVQEGKIWSSEDLPAQFDLSKAVIVSFVRATRFASLIFKQCPLAITTELAVKIGVGGNARSNPD
jgi:hypothetical protein